MLDFISLDKLYELCGTPVYLAPEIYVSGMFERSNPKCVGYSYPVDAWACGVIMFTLLIGKQTTILLKSLLVNGHYLLDPAIPIWEKNATFFSLQSGRLMSMS